MKPIEGTVVYVLEVPEDKVMYFDDVKWDYVLNRIYLPDDEEDEKAGNAPFALINGLSSMCAEISGK